MENKIFPLDSIFKNLLNALPGGLLVLDAENKAVYNNHRFREITGKHSDDEILEKKIGEIFFCVALEDDGAECGRTEKCLDCGANNAILTDDVFDEPFKQECRITDIYGVCHHFKMFVSPFSVKGINLKVIGFLDNSHERILQDLERTFFHDLNNILMVVHSSISILNFMKHDEKTSKYIHLIQWATDKLSAEIEAQQKLLKADKDKLRVDVSTITSTALLHDVINLFTSSNNQPERPFNINNCKGEFSIITDKTLLFRVISNMVKNAVEATKKNDVVTLSCDNNKTSLLFSVHNSGVIEKSVQRQIFQRAFSTKGKGRGTGTYSMKLFGEKYLKGKVWFESSEEKGTIFYLSIPQNLTQVL
jgi:Histidine kinase-, DNA gyrase B-, and HSP90-like ATPase